MVLFNKGDRTNFEIFLNLLIPRNPYYAFIRKSMYFRTMKKVISIIIIAYTNFCFAQTQASPFNSIGIIGSGNQSKKNNKTNLVSTGHSLPLDSITKPNNDDDRNISPEKLSFLIEKYERYLKLKNKKDSCNRSGYKLISYYKGNPRELNLANLMSASLVECSNRSCSLRYLNW